MGRSVERFARDDKADAAQAHAVYQHEQRLEGQAYTREVDEPFDQATGSTAAAGAQPCAQAHYEGKVAAKQALVVRHLKTGFLEHAYDHGARKDEKVARRIITDPMPSEETAVEALPVGEGQRDHAARAQRTPHLRQRCDRVEGVLQHIEHGHCVEGVGGQVHFQQIPLDDLEAEAAACILCGVCVDFDAGGPPTRCTHFVHKNAG